MEYTIIRSARRTLALEVRPDGIIVRAPFAAKERDIREFVDKNRGWIERHIKKLEKSKSKADALAPLTEEEIRALAERAKKVIPERVKHYAPKVGVTYGRITIRNQRSKWGSCSAKGNLNFNCLLMLAPPEVLDSVVVHELCHLKEMNHSERFYNEVLRVFPEYNKWNGWLKKNGAVLLRRMLNGMDNYGE